MQSTSEAFEFLADESDIDYQDCYQCATKTVNLFHIPRATEAICKIIPSNMTQLKKQCLAGDTSDAFKKDFTNLLLLGYGRDACRICDTANTH
jgi:hypothetical protein